VPEVPADYQRRKEAADTGKGQPPVGPDENNRPAQERPGAALTVSAIQPAASSGEKEAARLMRRAAEATGNAVVSDLSACPDAVRAGS
jgi:hypothetical protein